MSAADVFPSSPIRSLDFPVVVSATAPISPTPGTAWLDTSAGNVLKVWTASNVWITSTTPSPLPAAAGPDMIMKSGITAPYAPVWSDIVEGGTF